MTLFGRYQTERREKREAERAANMAALCIPSRSLHTGTYSGSTSADPKPPEPIRSEPYRRLVAAMRCINCGRAGPSQCAHANFGKGMGIKASDLETFPLCQWCHRWLDQSGLIDKEARRFAEANWARKTREAIRKAGTWPKNLGEWIE